MLALNHERVAIAPTGAITLSPRLRQTAGLKPGDELLIIWVPPDTFILRKWSDIVADDALFAATMRDFDQALTEAGHVTDEDVQKLIKEVRQEQYAEWAKVQ
jgi:bifunctional DNA-binding transcriptional regulator/antitoxin component of YhaV-PrlF toxin-antitoxin module